jgi:hypothetical protein
MRKRCRRVRSRGKVVLNAHTRLVKMFAYIQADEADWENWNFRNVSQHQAQQLVRFGDAYMVTRQVDGRIEVVGYRATNPTMGLRKSPTSLTFSTMRAVINFRPGVQLERHERQQVEKFIAWPMIGDTKAVAVRPAMTEAEQRVAEKMFRVGRLQTA